MSRSTDTEKTVRLNAAHRLLAHGVTVAEAVVSLSHQFAISRRQAYRYVKAAGSIGSPVAVAEPNVAATFKLPANLIGLLKARAAAEGITISGMASRALRAFLGEAGRHG
jgi:hypothetical protein